jgi:hypothetical protein
LFVSHFFHSFQQRSNLFLTIQVPPSLAKISPSCITEPWTFRVIVYESGTISFQINMPPRPKSSAGITAVGVFLFFGALMASLAGTTLVWRGTVLDRAWALNAPAYRRLAPFGKTVGVPFLLLGAILLLAGAGWFSQRLWAWRLAVAIIATQVVGDLVNVLLGDVVRGGVGFVIAGALLFYLLRPRIRATFV